MFSNVKIVVLTHDFKFSISKEDLWKLFTRQSKWCTRFVLEKAWCGEKNLIYFNIFPLTVSMTFSVLFPLSPSPTRSFAKKSPAWSRPALPLSSPAPVSTPWTDGQCQDTDDLENMNQNRVLSLDNVSSEEVCVLCIVPCTSPMLLSKLWERSKN